MTNKYTWHEPEVLLPVQTLSACTRPNLPSERDTFPTHLSPGPLKLWVGLQNASRFSGNTEKIESWPQSYRGNQRFFKIWALLKGTREKKKSPQSILGWLNGVELTGQTQHFPEVWLFRKNITQISGDKEAFGLAVPQHLFSQCKRDRDRKTESHCISFITWRELMNQPACKRVSWQKNMLWTRAGLLWCGVPDHQNLFVSLQISLEFFKLLIHSVLYMLTNTSTTALKSRWIKRHSLPWSHEVKLRVCLLT